MGPRAGDFTDHQRGPSIPEYTKLEFIKVGSCSAFVPASTIGPVINKWLHSSQEIGFTHMRILEGVGTYVQLAGLLARLCRMVSHFHLFA